MGGDPILTENRPKAGFQYGQVPSLVSVCTSGSSSTGSGAGRGMSRFWISSSVFHIIGTAIGSVEAGAMLMPAESLKVRTEDTLQTLRFKRVS